MEPIKDLDILLTDAQKIVKFAKVFTRLPEVLQAVSSAETRLAEIAKSITSKEKYLEIIA